MPILNNLHSMTKHCRALVLSSLMLIGLGAAPAALADDAEAAKTIAGILVGLNHFPSADDKATLAAIAEDDANGMAVRSLATAVAGIQHSASAEGKAALEQIVMSDMASAQTKSLAKIVLGINHVPSAEAKASLQAML